MNANMSFELQAAAFRIMTGHMAPGKDVSPAGYSVSYEERCQRWAEWLMNNHEIINAMLKAVDKVLSDELSR